MFIASSTHSHQLIGQCVQRRVPVSHCCVVPGIAVLSSFQRLLACLHQQNSYVSRNGMLLAHAHALLCAPWQCCPQHHPGELHGFPGLLFIVTVTV
jgi:hypothetical protein